MIKNILVFSNGEKIGDGIIKLPLLHEIKRRLPEFKLIWVTNLGKTVYSNELKNISNQYIDQIIEKVDLNPFFWNKVSKIYDFEQCNYTYILDTQKALYRTIALKRINSNHFISMCANGIFSTTKIPKKDKRNYYLDDLLGLLNLIKEDKDNLDFKIQIPKLLDKELLKIFDIKKRYIGLAPGAGEKNKIWPIEKFIKVGKYYEERGLNLVLYLGPEEKNIRERLKFEFPDAILPEEMINNFTNFEIVMSSTKYLSCALANDSGISHMLSTKYCTLIKLFGPKDSKKFTPNNKFLNSISSLEFGGKDVSLIPVQKVISEINKILN